jgi:hypothetical protein
MQPMKLIDLLPDPGVLVALEPDELGLRILPVLADWPHQGNPLQLSRFLQSVLGDGTTRAPGKYGFDPRSAEIQLALREAWTWLEGQALLIPDLRYHEGVSALSRRAFKTC